MQSPNPARGRRRVHGAQATRRGVTPSAGRTGGDQSRDGRGTRFFLHSAHQPPTHPHSLRHTRDPRPRPRPHARVTPPGPGRSGPHPGCSRRKPAGSAGHAPWRLPGSWGYPAGPGRCTELLPVGTEVQAGPSDAHEGPRAGDGATTPPRAGRPVHSGLGPGELGGAQGDAELCAADRDVMRGTVPSDLGLGPEGGATRGAGEQKEAAPQPQAPSLP